MADVKKQLEYSEATQTLVGQQRRELMDTKTGELMHVDQITKMVYGSKNFWKCYLMDFLSVLGIMDSKQVDIFTTGSSRIHPDTDTALHPSVRSPSSHLPSVPVRIPSSGRSCSPAVPSSVPANSR